MNSSCRPLVEAIVASFRDPAELPRQRLRTFTKRDWQATEFWLDTSGLALYFLDRVKAIGAADSVDGRILHRLEEKRAHNARRFADQFREFAELNKQFRAAGVCYANVKGFTLFPHTCPDLTARVQSDFDFLVESGQLSRCRALLEQRGYILTAATARTWEFKTPVSQRASIEGQYQPGQPRSVELHFSLDGAVRANDKLIYDPHLDRLGEWKWGKECFPALRPSDQLIGQALHIFGHLRNEHTRPSWLLEFRRHALARRGDRSFWNEVRDAAVTSREVSIALSLAAFLSSDLFGESETPALAEWPGNALPPLVADWRHRYGRRAVLADVPGTKLYLLLERALQGDVRVPGRTQRLRRVFPIHLPARIMPLAPRHSPRERFLSDLMQLRFLLYRTDFHIRQGIVYALEAWRCNRVWRSYSDCYGNPSSIETLGLRYGQAHNGASSAASDTK